MKEDILVEQLHERNEEAFANIISTYSQLLWTIASGFLSKNAGCSPEDVEECVSDVFIELWNCPDRYNPDRGSLKSYLCSITRNKAINAFHKKKRNNVLQLDEEKIEVIEEIENIWDEPNYTELYEAIRDLSEPTREILIRRYFYEQKPMTIADKMTLSKKEIENRLYRGKKALFASLSKLREVK